MPIYTSVPMTVKDLRETSQRQLCFLPPFLPAAHLSTGKHFSHFAAQNACCPATWKSQKAVFSPVTLDRISFPLHSDDPGKFSPKLFSVTSESCNTATYRCTDPVPHMQATRFLFKHPCLVSVLCLNSTCFPIMHGCTDSVLHRNGTRFLFACRCTDSVSCI